MIEANIKRKLGQSHSRAHERAEDLMTSTVFGLLRYLPFKSGLAHAVGRARPVRRCADGVAIRDDAVERLEFFNIGEAESCDLHFWPSMGRYGEPDLVATFADGSRRPVHVALIEAKLYSPKSGEAGEDDDAFDEAVADPDQLVRYWQALATWKRAGPDVPRTVVYLTAHPTPPLEELQATLDRAPQMRLAWLSWRDIWQVAHALAHERDAPLPAVDLARLLAHYGFYDFHGFHGELQELSDRQRFWTNEGWFNCGAAMGSLPPDTRFWGGL